MPAGTRVLLLSRPAESSNTPKANAPSDLAMRAVFFASAGKTSKLMRGLVTAKYECLIAEYWRLTWEPISIGGLVEWMETAEPRGTHTAISLGRRVESSRQAVNPNPNRCSVVWNAAKPFAKTSDNDP